MGGCNHTDEGGRCIRCKKDINTCCGPDKECEECGYKMCYVCYEEVGCVVCSGEKIPMGKLIRYMLKKSGKTIKEIKEEYRREEMGK